MNIFLKQLGWQMLILFKNNLINISLAITLIYGLTFYFLRDIEGSHKLLTLLVFNDPAIIALFFIGLAVINENSSNTFIVYMVSPSNVHQYILARLIALSIVGSACACLMTYFILGNAVIWWSLFVGVFCTCLFFGLAGIIIVSYMKEFLKFLLVSIPVLMIFGMPLFIYFGIFSAEILEFTPVQGAFDFIQYGLEQTNHNLQFSSIKISVWMTVFYSLAYYLFKRQIKKSF